MTMQFVKDVTEIIQHMVEIAAIVVGGVWAYYKFLRMRTFKSRLDLAVRGEVLDKSEPLYLSVILKAQNIGLTRVRLEPKSAGLRILVQKGLGSSSEVARVEWERLATYPLFEGEEWVEPGETLQDSLLITIPAAEVFPIRLEALIVCQGSRWLNMMNRTRRLVRRSQEPSSLRWLNISIVSKKAGETPNAGKIEAARR